MSNRDIISKLHNSCISLFLYVVSRLWHSVKTLRVSSNHKSRDQWRFIPLLIFHFCSNLEKKKNKAENSTMTMKQKWNSQRLKTDRNVSSRILEAKPAKLFFRILALFCANFNKLIAILSNGRGILKCKFKFLFQRVLTIFNAALYGGAVITTSLDYFVEHSVMLKWVWDRVCVKDSDPISWHSWAIVGAWPLTFILGEN